MSPYIGDLEAIATALTRTLGTTRYRQVTVMTSSRSALKVLAQPRQQSGQRAVQEIYRHVARCQHALGAVWRARLIPTGGNLTRDKSWASEARKREEDHKLIG